MRYLFFLILILMGLSFCAGLYVRGNVERLRHENCDCNCGPPRTSGIQSGQMRTSYDKREKQTAHDLSWERRLTDERDAAISKWTRLQYEHEEVLLEKERLEERLQQIKEAYQDLEHTILIQDRQLIAKADSLQELRYAYFDIYDLNLVLQEEALSLQSQIDRQQSLNKGIKTLFTAFLLCFFATVVWLLFYKRKGQRSELYQDASDFVDDRAFAR